MGDIPIIPLSPITLASLIARLPYPVAAREQRELDGTMCLPARMCSCVYTSGLGPAEVVAGSLLHLVCFGSYVSQPICCFCSMFSHCLPVQLPSAAVL